MGLKITEKNYKTSPPRVELKFNNIINLSLNQSNIKIEIKSIDTEETVEPELQLIVHEKGSKQVKIYLEIEKMIEKGTLTINLLKDNLIHSLVQNETVFFRNKRIEVQDVEHYHPDTQVEIIEESSHVVSYCFVVLIFITLLDSASSFFDFIKFGQMLGFIALLNFEHPENLKAILDFLRMNFLNFTPRFSSDSQEALCTIDKDKFVDEEFSCYIMMDQGRYLLAMIGLFIVLLILRLINKIKRTKFIEKKLITNMKGKFWNRYFEVIRLDLFISISLTMTKIGTFRRRKSTWMVVNFLGSFVIGFFYFVLMIYQFCKIHQFGGKGKKSKQKNRERKSIVNHKGRKKPKRSGSSTNRSLNSHLRKNRVHSQFSLFMINSTRNRSKNKINLRTGNSKKPKKTVECLFTSDKKTQHFYQRYHLPLLTLKDIAISAIIVAFYNQPKIQTLLVWVVLMLFLALDFYYKPEKDERANQKDFQESGLYSLITGIAMLLTLVEGRIDKTINYYFFGYLMIFLIVVLVYDQLKSIFTVIFRIGLRFWLYCKKRRRAKVKEKSAEWKQNPKEYQETEGEKINSPFKHSPFKNSRFKPSLPPRMLNENMDKDSCLDMSRDEKKTRQKNKKRAMRKLKKKMSRKKQFREKRSKSSIGLNQLKE